MNFQFIRLIKRDLKNGELRFLSITLVLALFSFSSILFFTEGFRSTLLDKTGTLLGGDRIITSPVPIDPSMVEKASELNLKMSESVVFLSMLLYQQDFALSEIKAVDANYPLKGTLQGSDTRIGNEHDIDDIPETGTVWLDSTLFDLLNLSINDTLKIGEAHFKVTRCLTFEPDRAGQGITIAPRALININDVDKTKVLQAGSLQTYKLAVTGAEKGLEIFDHFVTPKLTPVQNLKKANSEQSFLENIFQQTTQYLTMVLLINTLIAGLAISQAMRQFCQKQKNSVALLRCFGASFRWIMQRYILEIVTIGLVFSTLGFLLGALFFTLIKNYFVSYSLKIDQVWAIPLWGSVMVVLALMLFFGLPPLLKLRNVSPLYILRKNGRQQPKSLGISKIAGYIFSVLSFFTKRNTAVKYGIANLFRYASQNGLQIAAFSLVMIGAFLLFLVHFDLMHRFQAQIPKEAPNFFAINIETIDVNPFEALLKDHHIQFQKVYPIIRARLLSINDEPVAMNETTTNKGQKRVPRLLNLSYTSTLPSENKIISGQFFSQKASEQTESSIEKGFADRLGIKLGDELTFQIGEKNIKTKVTSIRSVNWDSFYPNFFVLFPPVVLDDFPKTYMTSFYVPVEQHDVLKPLIEQFPSVNLIDISMLLKQAESLIHTISMAIQFLLLFSALLAIVMLFCSLYSHLDERKKDALLFRILGASKKTIFYCLITEYALIGLCSGVIASLAAYYIYIWLAASFFKLSVETAWQWLGLGPLIGVMFVGLLGWVGLRKVIQQSPKILLSARF